ncbi:MAG: putative DNA binding domain-containing protein [Chloroflexi bacterium]|nr:putative DNA binding domain-containing protein [Chloroflexota bacterium]
MVVSNRPELYAALGQGPAGFDEIRGTPESDWIDFKRAPYQLDQKKGKLELAKDISGFANSGGGVLVVGVETERQPVTRIETASRLTPVRTDLVDCDQIRKLVRQYVYAPINRLECEVWEMSSDGCILTIDVPDHGSDDAVLIVIEGVSSEGEPHGNMFGYFERVGDATVPVPYPLVHDLMRDGLRFRTWGPGAAPVASPPKAGEPEPIAGDQRDELRRARAQEDAESVGLEDEPHLLVQAWLPTGYGIRDIHGQFRQAFLRPPQLRQHGFNMDFGQGAEVLEGGGLRKTTQGTEVLSVLPNGLTTLVVGSSFLGWAMESRSWGRELINPISLVEFVYEFCRFVSTHVRDASGAPDVSVEARLRRLDIEGPRELAPGGLHMYYGMEGARLPGGGAPEIVAGAVSGADPDQAAFELLAGIYEKYGLPESAIPFGDPPSRSISRERFLEGVSD